MRRGRFTGYICTGTLISDRHVLTAGHCVDTNNDGSNDFKPRNISYFVNGESAREFVGDAVFVNPSFTGFNNPSVNDDVAIIRLKAPVTDVTPATLSSAAVNSGTTFQMVGFGRSGNGVDGYTTDASLTTKRVGYNAADVFDPDDEGVGGPEVWIADFDHPTTPVGYQTGGGSLGNQEEANLGGGDSGGPSFLADGSLAAINTFGFSYENISSPLFGTGLGGILIQPYLPWINDVLAGNVGGGGGGKGGGGGNHGGGRGNGKKNDELVVAMPMPIATNTTHGATRHENQSNDSGSPLQFQSVDDVFSSADVLTGNPGSEFSVPGADLPGVFSYHDGADADPFADTDLAFADLFSSQDELLGDPTP